MLARRPSAVSPGPLDGNGGVGTNTVQQPAGGGFGLPDALGVDLLDLAQVAAQGFDHGSGHGINHGHDMPAEGLQGASHGGGARGTIGLGNALDGKAGNQQNDAGAAVQQLGGGAGVGVGGQAGQRRPDAAIVVGKHGVGHVQRSGLQGIRRLPHGAARSNFCEKK